MTIADKGRKLFDLVSVLPADNLDSGESERLAVWIASGRHGDLDYMCRPLDRTDPAILMPGVQTMVVVARFYSKIQKTPGIARYAQGEDYHNSIKRDLNILLQQIREDFPSLRGRAVVDSAPAFEKAWARKAGFGFLGRNSLVINPSRGSFFNLGLLLLDQKFPKESVSFARTDCGECRKCIDSCPMHAIGDDMMIDARRCISALTVERGRRGGDVKPIHGWIHGCDECQICCPFNDL